MASTRVLIVESRNARSVHRIHSEVLRTCAVVIATVLVVFVVGFICTFLYEYIRGCLSSSFKQSLLTTIGSRLTSQDNTPIPIGKIAKNAFVTTLTLGLIGICSARHFAGSRIPVTNAERGTV